MTAKVGSLCRKFSRVDPLHKGLRVRPEHPPARSAFAVTPSSLRQQYGLKRNRVSQLAMFWSCPPDKAPLESGPHLDGTIA
jgi:hypothetical protein